jgi:hypothetical protein
VAEQSFAPASAADEKGPFYMAPAQPEDNAQDGGGAYAQAPYEESQGEPAYEESYEEPSYDEGYEESGESYNAFPDDSGEGLPQEEELSSLAETSGVGVTYRFAGKLERMINATDMPGGAWSYIYRLAFDPFKDMSYRVHPWPLKRAQGYELRFLSRDKAFGTRESVIQGLSAMGFKVYKLFNLKEHIRLPGRSASLTMWTGLVQWKKPNSIITHDDPFFFETVVGVKR